MRQVPGNLFRAFANSFDSIFSVLFLGINDDGVVSSLPVRFDS
jgi:hypothetical protein